MGAKKKRGRGRPPKSKNRFARWIESGRFDRQEVAERLGVSRKYVDKLCGGARRPDLEMAFKIQDLTRGKIAARFWLTVKKHSED